MAGCRFGSPDLVTSLSGTAATPTFAFDTANANYFGLAGSFTSNNGAVCSFPTRSVGLGRTSTYAITPLIVTSSGLTGRTTTCSVLAPPSITPSAGGSTTYSGIECPTAIDNQFAPGTYTLRFSLPAVNGAPSISSRVFIIASPTFVTDSVATTIVQTMTLSAGAASTSIVTDFTATVTETASSAASTTTFTSSATTTVTVTDTIQTCANATSSNAPSTSSSISPSPTASLPVSLNGQCGNPSGQTCLGSTFGNCCSMYGYCGSSDIYCLTTEGCQSEYGSCVTPSPVSTSALPTSTIPVSPDGSCGGTNGYVCAGTTFGDCCSPYGWCGSSRDHCGPGCQPLFGTCNTTSTATGTAPLPSSTLKVSLDGACGGTSGQTCLGSDFGSCCSEYGYCGSTSVYCGAACQPEFGTCSTSAKRSTRKLHLRAASFLGARRQLKRAIGGAGPDYTYPPVPHTTITAGITQIVTVTPSVGVSTTTALGVSTTTVGSGVLTVTEAGGTVTSTETVAASSC